MSKRTEPLPPQRPAEALWTERRAGIARTCDVIRPHTSAERRVIVRRGEVARREWEMSALTRADLERAHRVELALDALDEEQAELRAALERVTEVVRDALEVLDSFGEADGELGNRLRAALQ